MAITPIRSNFSAQDTVRADITTSQMTGLDLNDISRVETTGFSVVGDGGGANWG